MAYQKRRIEHMEPRKNSKELQDSPVQDTNSEPTRKLSSILDRTPEDLDESIKVLEEILATCMKCWGSGCLNMMQCIYCGGTGKREVRGRC